MEQNLTNKMCSIERCLEDAVQHQIDQKVSAAGTIHKKKTQRKNQTACQNKFETKERKKKPQPSRHGAEAPSPDAHPRHGLRLRDTQCLD